MSNIVLPVELAPTDRIRLRQSHVSSLYPLLCRNRDDNGRHARHCQSPSEYHMRVFKLESRILLYCLGDVVGHVSHVV